VHCMVACVVSTDLSIWPGRSKPRPQRQRRGWARRRCSARSHQPSSCETGRCGFRYQGWLAGQDPSAVDIGPRP
jgi:hypothetical protein